MSTVQGGQGNIVTNGLVLNLDAANPRSYPQPYNGTDWQNLVPVSGSISGSLTNGVGYTGSNGGALTFDGVDDYIALGTFTGLGSTNRTISVWFKATSLPAAAGRIITFPANDSSTDTPAYALGINAAGVLQCGIGGTPYDGYNLSISYTLNTWTNIVASITGNTMTTYKNSVFLSSVTNTGVVATNPIGYLGRYNGNYGQYVTGNIAITQVYNRALNASEVLQNFNATRARFGV